MPTTLPVSWPAKNYYRPRFSLRAVGVSTALAFAAGALVAAIQGGPVHFTAFKGPLASFAISAVIGVTAGLSNADDTGRRYLIGAAAAVQLAIFLSSSKSDLYLA